LYILLFYYNSHREGIVCEKDTNLEFHYTKKAAEMGLLDA